MMLAALRRAGVRSSTILKDASLRCCRQQYAQISSPVHSRVFLRFASVKTDLPAQKKSRAKTAEPSVTEKVKTIRSAPLSAPKSASTLAKKGASVSAKETVLESRNSVPLTENLASQPTQADGSGAAISSKPSSAESPSKPSQEVTENIDSGSSGNIPPPPPPAVGIWLMTSSLLVLAVVIVGGVTRLTESGLSITEWRPITGVMPPRSAEAWEEEFSKYRATPEFKMLNQNITLEDFKRIYFMEWSHRILGRLIGAVFVLPLAYFTVTKKISAPLALRLGGLGLLIGVQGAMGWYMVQSGLEDSLLETPGAVPRVSHYRLAAHLGLAFALYIGMFSYGLSILKDSRFIRTGLAGGLPVDSFVSALKHPIVRRLKTYSWALTGLVLLTALSGVFVAGLDAGLVYNEWPLMGGRLAPPSDELFSPAYAKNENKADLWRNIFENPTTVQFDHRLLATTTYAGLAALFAQTFRPAWRSVVPPLVTTAARAAFAMANVQVLLGISTLIYLVPVPLAAAHQGGSILLLSAMLHLLLVLRRPSAAAQAWRKLAATKLPKSPPPA
ncbi:electron transfer protein 1 [Favolaschia claudopus]|uniref:Electron transfer protein 1 n=1 Tax=Favolaschia claudopus TaxID=2862362 RepID=A0AAW0EAX4_9AGAR